MHVLEKRQELAVPLESVFQFFQQPENLDVLTPPWLRFRMLTPGPLQMRTGAVFDYRISMRGIPLRWTAAIVEYDPPHEFVDLQLRGPYSFWHHRHSFESTERGTLVTDCVHYELPFGPLGRWAHTLWTRSDLERVFDFRCARLSELQGEFCRPRSAPANEPRPMPIPAALLDTSQQGGG
jgi:ligand-binding SRPBCC domain-containing protein